MKNSPVGSRKSARATTSTSSSFAATETIVASNSRSARVNSQAVDNKRKEKKAKIVAEPDITQTQDEREDEPDSGSDEASRRRDIRSSDAEDDGSDSDDNQSHSSGDGSGNTFSQSSVDSDRDDDQEDNNSEEADKKASDRYSDDGSSKSDEDETNNSSSPSYIAGNKHAQYSASKGGNNVPKKPFAQRACHDNDLNVVFDKVEVCAGLNFLCRQKGTLHQVMMAMDHKGVVHHQQTCEQNELVVYYRIYNSCMQAAARSRKLRENNNTPQFFNFSWFDQFEDHYDVEYSKRFLPYGDPFARVDQKYRHDALYHNCKYIRLDYGHGCDPVNKNGKKWRHFDHEPVMTDAELIVNDEYNKELQM
jgi:hypothetical protein